MILLVHMLLGALIGQKVANPFLAILLAFLSHYFLDLFPHIEYDIKDKLKIFIDFSVGIILIFLFSNNYLIIFISAFFAILPDGFTVLNSLFKNEILEVHGDFHGKKIHFLKQRKISIFWRIFSQVTVVIICIILFKVS